MASIMSARADGLQAYCQDKKGLQERAPTKLRTSLPWESRSGRIRTVHSIGFARHESGVSM
jgi:hypothetical protein